MQTAVLVRYNSDPNINATVFTTKDHWIMD